MGLDLVYVIYLSALLIVLLGGEPTYRNDNDNREFDRIIEHIRSNIDNK